MASIPLSQLKIICVDDEPELLEIVRDTVARQGFQAIGFGSAAEAIAALPEHLDRLVLIVSDIKMPEIDGLEFRRRTLDTAGHIPFLVLSGYITREIALTGLELKISAFVEKPFQPVALIELIHKEATSRMTAIQEEAELFEGFCVDATGLFEEIERLLLEFEANPQAHDTINRIFALAHTVKGSSGFFKPDTLHRFMHRYEDFLSRLRKGEIPATPDAVTALLKGLDTAKQLLASLKHRDRRAWDIDALTAIFTESPVAAARPEAARFAVPAGEAPAAAKPGDAEIRVATRRLDEFMELSGEITVIRNMINKLIRVVEKGNPGDRNVSHLAELFEEMHRINATMQDRIIDLRKVAMKSVFRPIPRAIRDLTRSLNKDIRLEIRGEELRIDTSLAEVLNACLIHMVRNSADHGIENPEQRIAAGKPAQGTLRISAEERNEEILVGIEDDGRGIDPAVVGRKLIEKGLRTAEQVARMTDPEIQRMIFEPGFSTAATISDVSGRGVGTDMVMRAVTAIGGAIEIDSKPGRGTRFLLRLPIPRSVLIVPSLMVRIREEVFAIPQESITRLLRLDAETREKRLTRAGAARFIELDGHLTPLIDARPILGLAATDRPDAEDTQVVLLRSSAGSFGICVDEILDVEDTVTKRLARNFRHVTVLAGATFLDAGRIGLILNVDGIAERAGLQAREPQARAPKPVEAAGAMATHPDSPQDLLLFRLDAPGIYGVPLSEIFRLEELDAQELRYSGEQRVVIYRGQVMPILDLARAVNLPPAPSKDDLPPTDEGALPTLILKRGERFVGVTVRAIVDLSFNSGPLQIERSDRAGLLGSCIVQDRVVTLIDLATATGEARAAPKDDGEEATGPLAA